MSEAGGGATPPRARPATEGESWEHWDGNPGDAGDRFKGRVKGPVFLGREIYRRRRLMDTARLLPAFSTVLFLLPMLWAREHNTAAGVIYLFLVWLLLILITLVLARRLTEPLKGRPAPDPDGGDLGG